MSRKAFTLIELLVVISIIALLIALLLPALNKAKDQWCIVQCQSNERQLTIASIARANDHEDGMYSPTPTRESDDLNPIIPEYLAEFDVAVCPCTQNVVDPTVRDIRNGEEVVVHMLFNAQYAYQAKGGHSYEIWDEVEAGIYPDGTEIKADQRKTIRNIDQFNASASPLIFDGDDIGPGQNPRAQYIQTDGIEPGAIENWPDEWNNHGARGLNVSFLDGHARWVDEGLDYAEVIMFGYISRHMPAGEMNKYFEQGRGGAWYYKGASPGRRPGGR